MSNAIDPHTIPIAGRSRLRELLALAARPEVLSFALGMPAEETFPRAALAAAAGSAAADASSFQYGLPSAPLKRQIVALMAARGVDCTPEQIFLTAGAQQGMDLVTRLLAAPGDPVWAERTVYEGTLLAVESRGAKMVAVDTTERGLDLDRLERRLAGGERPAYLFLIPDGHNPLGVDLPAAARVRLVELARRYDLTLVEDDAYGSLVYDGPPTPPLRALDPQRVIYLGTFSKILAPALRVGWIVAPETAMPALSSLKHASDLDSATFSQRLVSRLLDSFDLESHCAELRRCYRRRRDAVIEALGGHLDGVARWHRPSTGFYVWLELPAGVDATALLATAIERERVAFSPGAAFVAAGDRSADHCLRLSFARLAPDAIEEGVRRLRRALDRCAARAEAVG